MKIKDIAEGWTNLAKKHLNMSNERVEELAIIRYSKCLQCIEQEKLTLLCKKCGCYTPSKVRAKESVCPINKW